MIRQLFDAANAVTTVGLVLSVTGISVALSGNPDLGVAIVLWALLADHLDGIVAMSTKDRPPEIAQVGKNLDSLADLVSGGVFPAVVGIVVGKVAIFTTVAGAVLICASALRLSYFNVVGSPDGRFIGVPTTYAMPATAIAFLARPLLPDGAFSPAFAMVLVLLAALHVAPVRVPKTAGPMYLTITIFCIAASVVLAVR
ncbi:MAG: CDP-alcohol phosphatidyltransferase family protein [Sinorhizobium meliloti]|nr:CDP-alcohol phosphatidyltransferase family protein [Sinorhizobium meliloti]